MPKYQATWRQNTQEAGILTSVDRVGKVFTAPNMLEAQKIASQLLSKEHTLINVVELEDAET